MTTRQRTLGKLLILLLLVAHLLPVWGFKYFPTQDGASHIYNAYVLKEYHDPANYRLREVYELNATPFPNWTSHVLLVLLLHLFPPLVCEKIVLTLCIGLLPFALLYFLKGVQPKNAVFGLLGFLYAYNYLLHMGFYNFVLSMSLFFFALGYWWRVKEKLRFINIAILYGLLTATYFTHYHSYALLLMCLTFFAAFLSAYTVAEQIWGPKARTIGIKAAVRLLKPALIFIGSLIPAYIVLFAYYFYLSSTHGYSEYRGAVWLMDYLLSMKSLVAFRDEHIHIGQALLLFFAIAFGLTLRHRIRAYRSETGKPIWQHVVTRMDGFLLMALLITFLYFIAPWAGYSGGWINDRFHLYIFLVLLPFFAITHGHRYITYGIAGVLVILSLLHLGYNVHTYSRLNRDIAAALSLDGMDERDTILMSEPGEWGGFADALGFEPKYVEPFGHIECLLAVKKGIAYLDNYEADTDHFPLRYKDRERPADYAIIWRTEYDAFSHIAEEYELVDSTAYNRLYRRKRTPPDPEMWGGRTQLSFDMQPETGETAPTYIPVYPETDYSDGRYGWLTASERTAYPTDGADTPQPMADSISGEEDAVFRVALPNGTYRVTCYFTADPAAPLEITLIAGGTPQIQRLQIPPGNETLTRTYTVTVTDEHLTQVIHTRGQQWGWSGFTVEPVTR